MQYPLRGEAGCPKTTGREGLGPGRGAALNTSSVLLSRTQAPAAVINETLGTSRPCLLAGSVGDVSMSRWTSVPSGHDP